MSLALQQRLQGSQRTAVVSELLMNSIHFPLANIILELMIAGPSRYLLEPDLYIILFSCMVQAYFLGTWRFQKKSWFLLGNLIAPALYTIIEFSLEGSEFFSSPHHIAFWGVALAIGTMQQLQQLRPGLWSDFCIIVENIIRTSILLLMYAIFEGLTEPKYQSMATFFANDSHMFVSIVIPLIGLVVGFTSITSNRYLSLLQQTANQLRNYSEWLLGRELLSAAIEDVRALSLQRRERSVLFMDIRGFTHWSETKTPEEVVTMLNHYFSTAELIWKQTNVIKTKHTADEIMAVFATPTTAAVAALQLQRAIDPFLQSYYLSAGIGLHTGYLVEGLIGSSSMQMYDVIGDTVNTAKRICDKAAGGEVLLSATLCEKLPKHNTRISGARFLEVKGKQQPLQVHQLLEILH